MNLSKGWGSRIGSVHPYGYIINHNPGMMKTTNQECPESQFQNDENHSSGIVKIETQEVPKSQSNKTDINKTDFSETNPIYPYPVQSELSGAFAEKSMDVMDEMGAYHDIICQNISYDCFKDAKYYQSDEVDELVELMVEVMLMPDNSTIRIAGVDKPVAIVKNRFLKLEHSHIQYVLWCLQKNTSKVGNIKAYLLTTLYNAPLTIGSYYRAEVNHDMYGGG